MRYQDAHGYLHVVKVKQSGPPASAMKFTSKKREGYISWSPGPSRPSVSGKKSKSVQPTCSKLICILLNLHGLVDFRILLLSSSMVHVT